MVSKTFAVGIFAVLGAYLFLKWNSYKDERDDIETIIIDSWETVIKDPIIKFERLAVGINSNVDIIVPGVPLLKELKISPGRASNHDILSNNDDLQETFAFFFRKGSAAERMFYSSNPFDPIIKTAKKMPSKELYIGGNAALMATKAAALFPKVAIQFVGPVGPLLKKMMPRKIEIPKSSLIEKDEYHLIMEYKVGETWGSSTAPVATRFICSYDYSNSKLTMLDTFFQSLHSFTPDLVLMSGLHLLDSQTDDFFTAKISLLATHLKRVPDSVPIHLELASMATESFVSDILSAILPHVDSLGLNEQELIFASKAADGPHNRYKDHQMGQPEIHKMADILLWLMKTFGFSEQTPESRLSRIHFHSLTYHIIATVGKKWRNVESSVAAGAKIAGTQACNVTYLSPEIVDLKIPLKFKLFTGDVDREFVADRPVISFSREGVNFVFSPVLVCKEPGKTVGLGDAISTTGLMFSEFSSKSS